MVLETLRMVQAGLASTSYGVNVQIASGSFANGDTGPAQVATILDETRSAELAQGILPTGMSVPAVVITLNNSPDLAPEVESGNRDAHIELAITVAVRDPNTETANTNTYYTLRAVEKALRQFLSNAHSADRALNSIQIVNATGMIHNKQFKNPDDGLITGSLVVTFLVRDIAP